MNDEKSQKYFPALTGIRAIAAYLVYLHHTNPFDVDRFGNFIHDFVSQFHFGVNIFFVLSGFLITLRYYNTSKSNSPWHWEYFQNRIARIYPMYFILTTVTMIAFFVQDRQGQNPFFIYCMNISFLKGFFDDLKFTLIGQGWSLTVEECFYISAPLLFLGFKKNKWFIFYISGAFLIIGCLLVFTFHNINFYGFFNSYSFMFNYTLLGRCVEFFFGAGLVIYFRSQIIKPKEGIASTLLGIILITSLVILMSILDHNNLEAYSPLVILINNFLLPSAIAIFFYGLMRETSYLKIFLESRLLVTLGKASYTFYLIHVGIAYDFLNSYLPNDYFITFILLNIIALGMWYMLEEPINRWIRNL